MRTHPKGVEKYTRSLPDRQRRQAGGHHAGPKLLDRLRVRIRAEHYFIRTENAYVDSVT